MGAVSRSTRRGAPLADAGPPRDTAAVRSTKLLGLAIATIALGGCALPWGLRSQSVPAHPFYERCAEWSLLGGANPPTGGPTTTTDAEAAQLGAAFDALEVADPAYVAGQCLRMNQIQVLGSHNSYHLHTVEPLWSALSAFDPALAATLDYAHSPLAEQFSHEGIRQIELDVFADPHGGRYADRHLNPLLGLPLASGVADLDVPGFKVFHVQEVDYESSCVRFVTCLQQVQTWSRAHPGHLPIAIMLELMEDVIPDPVNAGFVQPIPYGAAELDALDAEIRSVFAPDELITPDTVRGDAPTLESAVLGTGWPTLDAARGKVLFLMDNAGSLRTTYLAGHPSLSGRVLFTNASPGDADAAFVKVNDPLGANTAYIQDLVRRGYVVRTRSDADTIEARAGSTTRRDAAFASGAQWVSTDYPVPGRSAAFGTDYVAQIPDGHPARCNPVVTGPRCRSGALEALPVP